MVEDVLERPAADLLLELARECGAFTRMIRQESKCLSSLFLEIQTLKKDIYFSGPVPVLVMSLVFIASVFMLHIWGKYTRAH